jgi:hypothetical protein
MWDCPKKPSLPIPARLAVVFLDQNNRTKMFHVKQFCPIDGLDRTEMMAEASEPLAKKLFGFFGLGSNSCVGVAALSIKGVH